MTIEIIEIVEIIEIDEYGHEYGQNQREANEDIP